MKIPSLISKTKILSGYQCKKSLYLKTHHKDLVPAVTPEQQSIFDIGHEVQEFARRRFSGGKLVDCLPWDFIGALRKTKDFLAEKEKILFEAAFEYKGCFAKADIITYSESTERWTIYEVKSGTKIKDEYLDDVGLQTWIMANSGLPIEQINLMYINPACQFPNLENLFVVEDVTEKLRERYLEISPKLNELFKSLRSESVPDQDIGPHCDSPNPCVFKEYCWTEKQIPEFSVLNLPGFQQKKWIYYQAGVVSVDDERLIDLNPLQERIVQTHRNHQPYTDQVGIKNSLSTWKYPLIFLDFETINPAIPQYPGTRPYQQVPFQFSVHMLEHPNAEVIHHEYLHQDESDPRPPLIEKLLEVCGKKGSIVAYYSQFEAQRLQEMADAFDHHRDELTSLISRLVDPLPIIRENIYREEFAGSFSLKIVAPTLLGLKYTYDHLTVKDGLAAQRAFKEIISSKTADSRKSFLVQACLDYCKQDTLVMVKLVEYLFNLS